MTTFFPQTGDVFFTRERGWFARVTCAITGPAGHQATFRDAQTLVEAAWPRVRKVAWSTRVQDMKASGAEWIVFRWVDDQLVLNRQERIRELLDDACRFEEYSLLELPLEALDTVINRWILRRPRRGYDVRVFRRLGDIWQNGVICSKTSNRALLKAGLLPQGTDLEYAAPSDTYRYLIKGVSAAPVAQSDGWFEYPGTRPDQIKAKAWRE